MPLPHQIGVFHDYEERKANSVLDLPPFYDPMGECFLIKLLIVRSRLVDLRIPSFACQRITYFQLDNYALLKSVSIGYNSFFPSFAFSLPQSATSTSPVRITNCPRLEEIIMDGWSFVFSSELILDSAFDVEVSSRVAVTKAFAAW